MKITSMLIQSETAMKVYKFPAFCLFHFYVVKACIYGTSLCYALKLIHSSNFSDNKNILKKCYT